jgi:ferritin
MLSKNIEDALNNQLELEAYASFLYLSMASWSERTGMEGTAKFFYRQSAEEHDHMMRIFHYILEMDNTAVVPSIDKPVHDFDSVQEVFNKVYGHERKVTQAINKIVDLAITENDHATHNFLQWFVTEQREEEALIRMILQKIELIGEGPQSLYFIDKEIEEINRLTGETGNE